MGSHTVVNPDRFTEPVVRSSLSCSPAASGRPRARRVRRACRTVRRRASPRHRTRPQESEMTRAENDPHNLKRFLDAQAPVIGRVVQELRNGRKTSHWMWFIFPQVSGLGHSDTARYYAVASRAEAEAYLAHPVLGPRLAECTRLAVAVTGRSAVDIFGAVDAAKFRSCMTLFG